MKTVKGKSKVHKKTKKSSAQKSMQNEIIGVCIIALSLLAGLSLYTSQGGVVGKVFRKILLGIFGISSYSIPLIIFVLGIALLQKNMKSIHEYKILVILLFFDISTLAHIISYGKILKSNFSFPIIDFSYYHGAQWHSGGFLGSLIGNILLRLVGLYGSYIVLLAILFVIATMITKISFVNIIGDFAVTIQKKIVTIKEAQSKKRQEQKRKKEIKIAINKDSKPVQSQKNEKPLLIQEEVTPLLVEGMENIELEAEVETEVEAKKEITATTEPIGIPTKGPDATESYNDYELPSIEFLKKGQVVKSTEKSKQIIAENGHKLEKTLLSFGVEAKILNIHKGPTVTRYELQPKTGVKVSKIVNLADDIALNLAATGIRIEAPIPGKSAVGIEVPNMASSMVHLREVIENKEFSNFPSKLAFALGKDIGGKPIVTDIAKMPHLLIAGATGSGKSVCINTLIVSILYKANPNEVKLIMIDPKVVELNVYNGIPHLLIPVVTDPRKAASALHWAVQEMTQRYKLFAENNVRDMSGYNQKVAMEHPEDKMPQIVIIIDELADLMMSAAKEVEDAICRLAQMARAAGIHLVIATQRPSVDVITGVIKANIPSRLAFSVSSGIDSRTILDMNGAEKLLGKGDMLFYPVGAAKPVRIQGAFVSDQEVENIVEAVKSTQKAEYKEDVLQAIESPVESLGDLADSDDLLDAAVNMVLDKETASISYLQRSLRVGFNRASRLMDSLQDLGIVSADEGSKPRRVLITRDQYESEETQ